MERMKRAISMLLAVVMIITVCPISAFATSEEELGQGEDTSVGTMETEPIGGNEDTVPVGSDPTEETKSGDQSTVETEDEDDSAV